LALCESVFGHCNYWESRAIHIAAEHARDDIEDRLRKALDEYLKQIKPDRGWHAYVKSDRIVLWSSGVYFEFDRKGTRLSQYYTNDSSNDSSNDSYYVIDPKYRFYHMGACRQYKERLEEISTLVPKVLQFVEEFR